MTALLIPAHGYVRAGQLTAALAHATRARGVQFLSERVESVRGTGTGAAVGVSGRTLDADAVVLAAGSWSAGVAGVTSWPLPVRPVRGQLLYLDAPARLASRIVWGAGCYLVPWRAGTVLVGATVEDVGFDEHPTAAGVRQLLNAALPLLPGLESARFAEVRVGLRPKTGDELPIIGRSASMPQVFYATGHYRNGILLTPLTARLVADLVLDGIERPELALTRPDRFGL